MCLLKPAAPLFQEHNQIHSPAAPSLHPQTLNNLISHRDCHLQNWDSSVTTRCRDVQEPSFGDEFEMQNWDSRGWYIVTQRQGEIRFAKAQKILISKYKASLQFAVPCTLRNLSLICGNGCEGKLISAIKMCQRWGAEKMKGGGGGGKGGKM